MLIQFRFKNFKSFKNEGVLDLTATAEKRHNEDLIEVNKNNILPVIAIHGANAAGKSTIFEALSYMKNLIKKNLFFDVNKEIGTFPFYFDKDSKDKPSEFEITVCLHDFEYRYGFTVAKNGFEEEWLYKKAFSKNSRAKNHLIFERQNFKDIYFEAKYKKYENVWNLYQKEINADKLLVLSVLATKENEGEIRDLYSDLMNISIRTEEFKPDTSITILEDEKMHNMFSKIINEFDPCLKGIVVDPYKDENDNVKYRISGVHKNIDTKKIVKLPLELESNGTKKIFNIVPHVILSLETGNILCVDELDTKLHPLLFRKIFKMYMDSKTNKKGAQLIFTTHSTLIFNSAEARRDQIYLVEKDLDGVSNLYSLADFKNLRADANYEKKYLSGQFGAIPFLNEEE